MVTRSNLFGRELTPEDVAKMVAFLCSDDTMNVTGAAFHVDGGGVMV
jgi:NAD(P)-dependent dehydrogenase (short-subunit alcohol dehydrogenase family)